MARRYRMLPGGARPPAEASSSSRSPTPTTSSPSTSCARTSRASYEIELRLAGESEIERAIDHYYGHELSIDGILHEIETGEIDYASLDAEGDEYIAAGGAAGRRAAGRRGRSAAPPTSTSSRSRPSCASATASTACCARSARLHKTYWPAMAVRIKVMSEDEHRRDARAAGRAHLAHAVRPRRSTSASSTQPTMHGENIVLRILDREKGIVPLDKLGLPRSRSSSCSSSCSRGPRASSS